MGRKLVSAVFVICVLLLMPVTAFAQGFDSSRTGSVSVTLTDPVENTPISGAEISLYYVATVRLNSVGRLSYTYTDQFAGCGSSLSDPSLALRLDTYVGARALHTARLVTDSQGKVTFTSLPLGLYFVRQTNTVDGYALCSPFLVTVPGTNADGYVYDINASPKTAVTRLTSITIKKVWNTDESTTAPDSVTVQLLKNGVVIETATLNARNNWQVTYQDMPESDSYSILEVDVPTGFTATYSQSGYTFTVTNTASLPETGLLVWPIPVLATVGLFLIGVGTVVVRRTENETK